MGLINVTIVFPQSNLLTVSVYFIAISLLKNKKNLFFQNGPGVWGSLK